MPLTVSQRREHWTCGYDGWVCDGCGDENEDELVMWTTGRKTRRDPNGERVVCLCSACADRIPHGVLVDQ